MSNVRMIQKESIVEELQQLQQRITQRAYDVAKARAEYRNGLLTVTAPFLRRF